MIFVEMKPMLRNLYLYFHKNRRIDIATSAKVAVYSVLDITSSVEELFPVLFSNPRSFAATALLALFL